MTSHGAHMSNMVHDVIIIGGQVVKARNMIRIKSFAQRRLKRHGNADNEIRVGHNNSFNTWRYSTIHIRILCNFSLHICR